MMTHPDTRLSLLLKDSRAPFSQVSETSRLPI
jgi:hypothetical protein